MIVLFQQLAWSHPWHLTQIPRRKWEQLVVGVAGQKHLQQQQEEVVEGGLHLMVFLLLGKA